MSTGALFTPGTLSAAPTQAQSHQPLKVSDALPFEYRVYFLKTSQWHHGLSLVLKRLVDIIGALTALALFAPVMVCIAALVAITSPGPILYKSLRIGRNQKPFYMYKFRTMVVDADRIRERLRKENNLEGKLFKLRRDPRITPIGGFLRSTSLDELPQILNVLKGEMSLVGPRPYVRNESRMFQSPYTLRFSVLPGMTGPWQASGRSKLDFEQLCSLEMDYVLNWSLLKDVQLILKTIPSVLLKKGAF